MPATQAQCDYEILPQGPISASALQTFVAAVPITFDMFAAYGVSLLDDVTTIQAGPTRVRRRVRFTLAAKFSEIFPAADGDGNPLDQSGIFWGLFRHVLGGAAKSLVTAIPPVIS